MINNGGSPDSKLVNHLGRISLTDSEIVLGLPRYDITAIHRSGSTVRNFGAIRRRSCGNVSPSRHTRVARSAQLRSEYMLPRGRSRPPNRIC